MKQNFPLLLNFFFLYGGNQFTFITYNPTNKQINDCTIVLWRGVGGWGGGRGRTREVKIVFSSTDGSPPCFSKAYGLVSSWMRHRCFHGFLQKERFRFLKNSFKVIMEYRKGLIFNLAMLLKKLVAYK